MPHFMISAAHKSSGKTTLSVGLCAALSKRGYKVQPFKKGPDYIDPLWLGAASSRSCYNLDFFTQERDEISAVFAARMSGADLGLIEGNKGLYDGLDLDGSNSNAALATLLSAPVILVLDTRGMTRGIAPLILGYQGFEQAIRIGGVILNHVGGPRHEGKLRRVIEHYTDVRVLGALGHNPGLQIEERHLGLMPSNEAQQSRALIDRLGEAVADAVDLDPIMALAAEAPSVQSEHPSTGCFHTPGLAGQVSVKLRIAYAQDEAFGFYYPADLEALQAAGAELIAVDCLNDPELPAVDGLFIGGGFPETRMQQLEANSGMRASIKAFIEAGKPAYVECGGLMYLTRSLTWRDVKCKMVGVLPADTVMHERPQGRGYVRMRETGTHPWRAAMRDDPSNPDCARGEVVAAHEFHYSGLENISAPLQFAYRVERGYGVDGKHDGIVYKNLLASYVHLRDTGRNRWAERFVAHVRACQKSTIDGPLAENER